ncbi:MAG: HD domain-containing phosphohydrolase [Vicinamibacterales bacterium]
MSLVSVSSGGQAGLPVLVVGESVEAQAVHRYLLREGVRATSVAGADQAMRAIDATAVAAVVLDIDDDHDGAVRMCRHVKWNTATRLIPVILLSDDRLKEHRLAGIDAGAEGLLVKPFDPDELLARIRAATRVAEYTSDLDSAASIIMTVTAMIEARESAPGHCYRMANYATALGRALHLGDADLTALYRGAFLHDIGMLSIPDGILHKAGRLDPEEYEIVKSHPVIGDALCANLRTLHPVRGIVRHHHERLDGSGYPDRLSGDAVPLLAQIVSIVDLFEAITMGREYVAPRGAAEALDILRHEVTVGWRRPDLVEAFAGLVTGGALEKFRGEPTETPAGFDELTSDLLRLSAAVGAPPAVADAAPVASGDRE